MKIIVTGASGHIGRQLLSTLAEQHTDRVIGLSRTPHKGLVTTDYSVGSLSIVFQDADVIIHLAAKRGNADDYQTFIDNEIITENILKAMQAANVRRIIFMSSIAVYSDAQALPWKENVTPVPQTYYGLSKLTCENLCRYYAKGEINYTILRCGIVYGTDEPGRMISVFIREAMEKKTLTLTGKSLAKRDYIYVKDVVAALLWSVFGTHEKNQIYNLGSNFALTNLEVAKAVNSVLENEGNLLYDDTVEESIANSYMDSSKIEKAGFHISFSFLCALEDIKTGVEQVKK